MQPRFDPWRAGAGLLLVLVLLPVIVSFTLLVLALRIALWIMGFRRHGGGGQSWLDAVLVHHVIARAFETRGPEAIQHLVIESPAGKLNARLEGEFDGSGLFDGHRVTLQGHWRDGVMFVAGGQNHTLAARFRSRRPRWRAACLALAVLALAEYGYLAKVYRESAPSLSAVGPANSGSAGPHKGRIR